MEIQRLAITSSISNHVENTQEKAMMMKTKSRKLIIKIGSVFSKKDQQEKSQIIYSQRIPSSHSPSNWSTVIEEHQSGCLWRFKVKTSEVCGGSGGGGRSGGGDNGDNGQGQGQGQGQGLGRA
ncbi:hypothetical protein H5410_055018 [Solanum commersonii]|uniref:Uncharacterized protein n=1 Tax=Solanum commersonii TaxID=4109 RepID=A0A9J5WI33_SOLCO|nr:hypothetical protein H5410_055018 [Solanum commersonii]